MYAIYIKRLLDIVLSLIAIIVLSPVYLIVAIVVRIQMGSPVLFSQDRIGKDEKVLVGIQRRFLAMESAISGFFYENARAL